METMGIVGPCLVKLFPSISITIGIPTLHWACRLGVSEGLQQAGSECPCLQGVALKSGSVCIKRQQTVSSVHVAAAQNNGTSAGGSNQASGLRVLVLVFVGCLGGRSTSVLPARRASSHRARNHT